MLDSHDYYLRLNAALAVAYLGDNNAFDRLVAMQREAATPVERVYLTAALAMLKQPNGAMELNEALVALAGSQEYGDGTDLFFMHRYLQEAVLDGLAAGGAQSNDFLNAWRAELEPLDPIPKPVVLAVSKPETTSSKQLPVAVSPRSAEHAKADGAVGGPLNVFISYSHQDEKMREKLHQHLASLVSSRTADSTSAVSLRRAPDCKSWSSLPVSSQSSARPSVATTCCRTELPSRRLSTICR
jgi:hypothetical protein